METSRELPSTHSSQQLMSPDGDSEASSTKEEYGIRPSGGVGDNGDGGLRSIPAKYWFTIIVLCFVNLINYMDRFTIAGVLNQIQEDFHIADDKGGLLQTAFVFSYMVFAPIFGFLGDRFSRRWIMVLGVTLWSLTTLVGSFMTDFWSFLIFRALVGIGEASYSTIAPTIISDLFVDNVRSKMLAMFYFAIPVGSGLGYIVGSEMAKLMGGWQWALRVTPFLGLIAVVLIVLTKEPQRGHSEGSANLMVTTYSEDIKDLAKNTSFMLSTAAFTCVAFVTGALAWWGPSFMHYGAQLQPGQEHITINEVSFKFGAISMVSGLLGVPLGSYLSQSLKKTYRRIDPVICGVGLLLSAPFIAAAMIFASVNSTIAYTLVFIAELALNMNWAIVADILLYVVIPTRRSTAEAFQILISHAFGDAGSPYIVGKLSELFKIGFRSEHNINFGTGIESLIDSSNVTVLAEPEIHFTNDIEVKFRALQYSLFTTCFIEILGGVLFLVTAFYIIKDKSKADKIIAESRLPETHERLGDSVDDSSS